MTDRERAIDRLKKLRDMQEGGTEEEALVAAQLAADIMTKYALHEEDVVYDDIERTWVGTGRVKHSHPIRYATQAIAALCDCRTWCAIREGESHVVYLGDTHDRMVADYLTRVIMRAMVSATTVFHRSPAYRYADQKTVATRSFQRGMMRRIAARIKDMTNARHAGNTGETGLVLQKSGLVNRKAQELGLRLRTTKSTHQNHSASYGAGVAAGNTVGLHPSVRGGTGPKQHLLGG